ncbi:immunity 26/phosphotriesterase HocA family protein, partial [Umezawaea sp. NPDC059074]|uniref:immunity 26/phosphotriesterase HocA family protein n=1 Tax=Umezawaea sp. NPDC059074 TaxID=3346716 RepID=UPI0036BFE9CF
MNLIAGRGSRKAPLAGDVFTLRVEDGRHLFGRVVETGIDEHRAPMPDAILVYVYDVVADGPDVDTGRLTTDALLLPPLFINRLPWSKGYFRTVAHAEPAPGDVLERHCFEVSAGRCVDRDGKPTTRTERCGV